MRRRPADVLFVCTGNAGRSQMAEALFRQMAGDLAAVHSAGVDPWDHLHPVAARLMHERGIDLTGHHPKHVDTMVDRGFDVVVTLGPNALAGTPRLPGNPRRIHWDIGDPADADGTPQQEDVFRRTMARIEERLPDVLALVNDAPRASELHLAPGLSTGHVRPRRFDPPLDVPMIADAGFRCIELNCCIGSDDFPWDKPAAIRELASVAADTGVEIFSVHSSTCWFPLRGDKQNRMAIDLCRTFADLTAELGAQVVVIHAGLNTDLDPSVSAPLLRDALEELQAHILPMPCAFAWENTAPGLTPEELAAWIGELNPGAFGFVLDTGHTNFVGDGDRYLHACGSRLISLHTNDNDGRRDQHIVPGDGTYSWDGYVDKLAAAGYVGPLMLEAFPPSPDDDLPTFLAKAKASVDWLVGQADQKA